MDIILKGTEVKEVVKGNEATKMAKGNETTDLETPRTQTLTCREEHLCEIRVSTVYPRPYVPIYRSARRVQQVKMDACVNLLVASVLISVTALVSVEGQNLSPRSL